MILTASLAALSVYLFFLYIQESVHERRLIQKRIQKITLGSYDLLQRAANQKGFEPLYRIKKRNPLDLKRFKMYAFMGIILAGLALQIMEANFALPVVILFGLPSLILYSFMTLRTRREAKIRNELPGTLDLMIICLGSGLGIAASFERVANEMEGTTLGNELRQIVNENSTGVPLEETLRNFSNRVNISEISNIVGPIIQAHKTGASIIETFKIQAEGVREKLKLQQKEKMMRTPILILLPMMIFIFPVIFVVALGPVMIRAATGKLF